MKKLESNTFIIAAFIITALASCVREFDGGKEKNGEDDMTLVTLTLSMPALPPATRVQGTSAENQVEEIDVLLFDATDNFLPRAGDKYQRR